MRKIVGADCTLFVEDEGWVRILVEEKKRMLGRIHDGVFEFSKTLKWYGNNSWPVTKELVDHSKSLGIEVFFLNTGMMPSRIPFKAVIARKRLKQLIKLEKVKAKSFEGFERQYYIPLKRWRTKGQLFENYAKLLTN